MAEIFLNPGFENWTANPEYRLWMTGGKILFVDGSGKLLLMPTGGSGSLPDNWTVSVTGGCVITQETDVVHGGTSSLKMATDGVPSTCQVSQTVALAAGAKYNLSLWRNHSEAVKTLKIQVKDAGSNAYLYWDSGTAEWLWDTVARWITIDNTLDMDQWVIGFQSHNSYTSYVVTIARGDDALSTVIYVDDCSLSLNEEDSLDMRLMASTGLGEVGGETTGGDYLLIDNADTLGQWSVHAGPATLTLDYANKFEGNASVLVSGITNVHSVVKIVKSVGSWDLSQYKYLKVTVKGDAGNCVNCKMWFGEAAYNEQGNPTQWAFALSSVGFKTKVWDISSIAIASRDVVTIIAFELMVAAGAGSCNLDFMIAAYGGPRGLMTLGSDNVIVYPQGHSCQSFERELFGDGSEGDETISVDKSLGEVTYPGEFILVKRYRNLTIDAGKQLEGFDGAFPNRVFVVLVKETLTINGTIDMNESAQPLGANPTKGGGAGNFGGGGGGGYNQAGAIRGAGGGGAGQDGEDGAVDDPGEGGGRRLGTSADPANFPWEDGGHCIGAGGNGKAMAAGNPGDNFFGTPRAPQPFEIARRLTGGGGGGGSTANGGMGGRGGGVVWIEARKIIWGANGKVQSKGQDGGAGAGANSGGGGGGGGGFIQILYAEKEGISTIEVNGGVAGVKAGAGFDGGSGADGSKGEFQVA